MSKPIATSGTSTARQSFKEMKNKPLSFALQMFLLVHTQIIQSLFCSLMVWFADITEVGRCAKASCEHTARSSPTLSDVVITLVEIGKQDWLH